MSRCSGQHVALRSAAIVATTSVALALSFGSAAAGPNVDPVGPTLREARADLPDTNSIPGVECVQKALGVPVDGDYGQVTFDAVQAFQAAQGLTVDGVVGPFTGDKLLLALEESEEQRCSQYVPTTYELEQPDGGYPSSSGAAVGGGKPLHECLIEERDQIYKGFKKILSGSSVGHLTSFAIHRNAGKYSALMISA